MKLKLLTYEESGDAYAKGAAAFDKRLPPLVETDTFTLREIGPESEEEDRWGVKANNEAQARLTLRQVVEMFDGIFTPVEAIQLEPDEWNEARAHILSAYSGIIEQLRTEGVK